MEQPNQINDSVNQLKGMMGFLTPSISFIVNAALGVITFVLFLLIDFGYGYTMTKMLFDCVGGIFAFLIILGLVAGAILAPMKTGRLAACVNTFISGFMILSAMAYFHWSAVTILMVIFALIWMLFTVIKKDDEIKL